MIEKGQRKVAMLKLVLWLTFVVVLLLSAGMIWAPPANVTAAIGPIALMWGGASGAAISTFNYANGQEHQAAASAAQAVPPS